MPLNTSYKASNQKVYKEGCVGSSYRIRGGKMIVVKSKIKELASGYNVSSDFADALDATVKELIKKAVKRAEGNNRRTVMAKDL